MTPVLHAEVLFKTRKCMGVDSAKRQQLGMSPVTARNQLVQQLLFHMAHKCGDDICFQCKQKKIPWLHSEDPKSLFFDLNNVWFSHRACNYGAARITRNKTHGIGAYKRGCRCEICKESKRKITRESNRRVRGIKPENYRR